MDETLETTEIAGAKATTPEAEADTTAEAGAAAGEEASADEEPEVDETDGEADQKDAPPFTVPVKFNKQYRELTPEEAGMYAQKGMKYESLEPQLTKLRFLGQKTGQSVEAMLDGLYRAGESLACREMLERAGGDEKLAAALMEAWKLKNKSAYEAMLAADRKAAESVKEDNNRRMADEFAELHGEFPEIVKIDDVPQSVIKAAVRTGRSLLSEYLLYVQRETKRIKLAEEQAAAAGRATTGTQAGGSPPEDTPEIATMRLGIWK